MPSIVLSGEDTLGPLDPQGLYIHEENKKKNSKYTNKSISIQYVQLRIRVCFINSFIILNGMSRSF